MYSLTNGTYNSTLTINNNPTLTKSRTIEVFSLPVLPFVYDFESDGGGFYPNGVGCSQWEWGNGSGKPNYGSFTPASFGSNSWFTRLSGTHGANTIYYLETPPINFAGANGDYYLDFEFRAALSTDAGMNLDYSVDGGLSWQVLGPTGMADPNAINEWYDTPSILGLDGEPGWAPNPFFASTVFNPEYRINLVKGFSDVRFRFKFGATSASILDGVQLDNFQISGNVLPLSKLILTGLAHRDHIALQWQDEEASAVSHYRLERAKRQRYQLH